jgi:hypothetical protein
MAQQHIEAEHPGATALVCIGYGGDANLEPRGKVEMVAGHGRAVADEVNRLLKGKLMPLSPQLTARRAPLQLPLDPPPTREEPQQRVAAGQPPKATAGDKRAAGQAAAWLAELDAGRALPASVDYSVTAWAFSEDLAMIFLPGSSRIGLST